MLLFNFLKSLHKSHTKRLLFIIFSIFKYVHVVLTIATVYSTASAPVSVEWGSATHRRKAQVRLHHRHHVSRPSLAAGVTTHSVQAGHDGVQVPSSHGAVIPSRHALLCRLQLVVNISVLLPVTIWQFHAVDWCDMDHAALPLPALRSGTRCHWLFTTWALHSLVSVADLKLNCISKHMMDTQHPRDRSL